MELLFLSYTKLLIRHGLAWVVKDNKKQAVSHFLSVVRPSMIRSRLESDLALSKISLRKYFKGFMENSIKVSEAFELVDNGTPLNTKTRTGSPPGTGSSSANKNVLGNISVPPANKKAEKAYRRQDTFLTLSSVKGKAFEALEQGLYRIVQKTKIGH